MMQHDDRISPLHGAGGEMMGKLLAEHVLPHFAETQGRQIATSSNLSSSQVAISGSWLLQAHSMIWLLWEPAHWP